MIARLGIAAAIWGVLVAAGSSLAAQPAPAATVTCWDGSPAATEQACPRRTFEAWIIFFDLNSAELTQAAARILDHVGLAYRSAGPFSFEITGHADRAGDEAYNLRLSQSRIDNVRAYLVARGIPAENISGEALGETRPIVETPDGVREPQNRYAVIRPLPAR